MCRNIEYGNDRDEIERLRGIVAKAIALCGRLAEQQAYPDDSWEREAAQILTCLERPNTPLTSTNHSRA